MNEEGYIKMDFSLTSAQERNEKVKEILANTPPEKLTPLYLNKLAEYIVEPITDQEKKEKRILTSNMMVTVGKREVSLEGLISKLENGEDGIYGMIANDKNIIFQPKSGITQKDLDTIQPLRELYEEILKLEEKIKHSRGKHAFALHKQLIEMRKDQYVIRSAYRPQIYSTNITKSAARLDLSEKVTIDEAGHVHSNGIINFYDEKHISMLLCNYSKIKEECWDKFNSDMKWLMEDLDNLIDNTLREDYPMYYDLLIYKIDGRQNIEIQELLYDKYGIKHSVEYISSLWRNKIPKLIVQEAENEYLIWYYTNVERGKWKRCSKCGQIKLAHNNFFSKNNTSKDGFYSICKKCRNVKNKKIMPISRT